MNRVEMKATEMWAVVSPDGEVLCETIRLEEEDSTDAFLWKRCDDWAESVEYGYRCVPVTVTVKG